MHDFSHEDDPVECGKVWMDNEMIKPFHLYENILFKVCLIKISEDVFYSFMKCHHLITDGWGYTLICRQMSEKYNAIIQGTTGFSEIHYSYKDFIKDDQNYSNQKDKEFWKEKLKNLPEALITRKFDRYDYRNNFFNKFYGINCFGTFLL